MNEVEIRVTTDDDTRRGLNSAKRSFSQWGKDIKRRAGDSGMDSGGKWAKGFVSFITSGLKPSAAAIATGFSAQIVGAVASSLASGAAKVAQGAGAMLALLPAAALTAGLALGTLKLALVGVGDALKAGLAGDTEKFNEALEGLAPSAQAVAREVVGLKGMLDSLKRTVQGNFFKPLIGEVKPLGEIYLRQAHLAMGELARNMGQAANGISRWLQVPSTFRAIHFAMQNAKDAATNLIGGLGNLFQAFLPLVTVGSEFLPALTDGFGEATAKLASFMREAERTGQLKAFIQRGIDAIKSLIDTGKQWVRILGNIGDIGALVFDKIGIPAGTLLDTIERLTEKALTFMETGKGDSALNKVLELGGQFAGAFFGTLQSVAELVAPILPKIGELLVAFMELKVAILDAVGPAVIAALGAVLPVLTSLMEWLAENKPVMQALLVALFTVWAVNAGIAAAATIAATWPLILMGAAIAGVAYLFIKHWNWIKDHWPLLISILTLPIAVAVAIIQKHWNTIKAGFSAVKDWIGARIGEIARFFQALPGRIAGAAGQVGTLIKNAVSAAARWVASQVGQMVNAIRSIPGKIAHAAGFVGTLIKRGINSARDWVKRQVNAIVDFITSIPGRLGNIGGRIKDKILGGLGDIGGAVASKLNPANWFAHGGVTGSAHGGIQGAATGGARSGLTMVGEHGRELVRLPAGSRVHGNAMTEQKLGTTASGSGGTTLNVYVAGSIRSDRELVRLIRDEWTRGGFQGAFG